MKTLLVVCLLALLQSVSGLAQTVAGLGAISGSVRDTSGATIANAEVTIENTAKGIQRKMTTNEFGAFSAPSLVPAAGYTVTTNKAGVVPHQSQDLALQVGQNLGLNIVMHVAGTLLQIDVETAAPLVEQT